MNNISIKKIEFKQGVNVPVKAILEVTFDYGRITDCRVKVALKNDTIDLEHLNSTILNELKGINALDIQ